MSEEPGIYTHGPPGKRLLRLTPKPPPPPAKPFRYPAAAPGKPRKRRPKAAPSVRYGPGRYTPAPNGRGFDCVICTRSGRVRARMPDVFSARAWIDASEAAASESLAPLTRAQLVDARDALALLPPGASLTSTARAWLAARAPEQAPSAPLSACRDAFLADRIETNIRPATYALYRQAANRLIKSAGDIPVAALTRDHVAALVSGLSAQSRNGLLRHIGAFLAWCAETGRAPSNPAVSVRKAIVPEPPRGVITPRQAAALLACAAARRPDLVPYLALGLFAGIRPDELYRLKPALVGEKYILLDGTVTKTSDTRNVAVRANLSAWLAAFPPPPGRRIPPLSKKHLYAALRRVRADTLALARAEQDPSLAIHAWPGDCLRHCFATYEYERTGNAAAVAAEMGHKGVQVFFTHYRALAAPGDGLLYAAITPENTAALTAACQRLL